MTKKIKQINIFFLSLFLMIQISSSINYTFADEDLSINEININEYNMSVLSVNQNDQIISAITAVKIENPTEKTFYLFKKKSEIRFNISPINTIIVSLKGLGLENCSTIILVEK